MTMSTRIYMDHNATSPLRPEARAAILSAMDVTGNPSSVHFEGRKARHIVEDARAKVAALVGANAKNVVFTSGATEANNWFMQAGWEAVGISRIEHDSVWAPSKTLCGNAMEMPVDANGVVIPDNAIVGRLFEKANHLRSSMVLQLANNETGVIQPVAEMAKLCREHGVVLHTDAVQAAGRMPLDIAQLGIASLSLSSHKIGGPTGVGALILGEGFELTPLITGGGQELRRRSGTENVSGIAGFGAAAECALKELADVEKYCAMRDYLERKIQDIAPDVVVFGQHVKRLPNTTCFSYPGLSAETLLIKLDLEGVAASSGAACSSGKVGSSQVLAAMGVSDGISRGAIRVSLGWNSSESEIETFVDVWRRVAMSTQRAVA